MDFTSLREIETLKNNCANKYRFLENVLTATEPISFHIIDRCRDTMMQINQLDHALHRLMETARPTSAACQQTETIIEEQKEIVRKATNALETILAWVPPGPGSRRTDR